MFVENETSRYDVYPQGPVGREPQLRTVLNRLLDTDPALWDSIRGALPERLTAGERAEALRLDQAREARGEFDTWQYG